MKALRMRPRGFTLLELLVAITVLSIVSIIAWRGLESLVHTRERLEPERDDVRAMLSAFGQLERDLAHAAVPSLFALKTSPVVVRFASDGPVLEIVRRAPPDETSATAIQTVYWRVADGVLLRQATPAARQYLSFEAEQLTNARLMADVKSMRVRIWSDTGWIDPSADGTAPPPDAAPPPPAGAPPAAVNPIEAVRVPPGIELTIERSNGQLLRRVLLVG